MGASVKGIGAEAFWKTKVGTPGIYVLTSDDVSFNIGSTTNGTNSASEAQLEQVATKMVGALAQAAGGTTPGPSAYVSGCALLTATPWQQPRAPYSKGDLYRVNVKRYSCAEATLYVKQLVTYKVSGKFDAPAPGGPPGWFCTGQPDKTGLDYIGQCFEHYNFTGPNFSWEAA